MSAPDVAAWTGVIVALTALGTLVLLSRQVTTALLATKVDLTFRLEQRFSGPEMQKLRAKSAQAIQVKNFEPAEEVLDFFELIAFFTRKGALDLEVVWHTFSWWERRYFVAMQEWIASRRELDGTLWAELIWLDEEIQELHRKRDEGRPERLTPEHVTKFLKDESDLMKEALDG